MNARKSLEELVSKPKKLFWGTFGTSSVVEAIRASEGATNIFTMLSLNDGGLSLSEAASKDFSEKLSAIETIAESVQSFEYLPEVVMGFGYGMQGFMYMLPIIIPSTVAYVGAHSIKKRNECRGAEEGEDYGFEPSTPTCVEGEGETSPRMVKVDGQSLFTYNTLKKDKQERTAPPLGRFLAEYSRLLLSREKGKNYIPKIERMVEKSPTNYQLLCALTAARSRRITDSDGEDMFALYDLARRAARQYTQDIQSGIGYRHFQFSPPPPSSERVRQVLINPSTATVPERTSLLLSSLQMGTQKEFLAFYDALYEAHSTDQRAEDILSIEHVKDEYRDSYVSSLRGRGIDELRERLSYLGLIAHQRDMMTPSRGIKQRKEKAFTQLYKLAKKLTAGDVGDLYKVGQTKHGFYTLTSGSREVGFKEGDSMENIRHEYEMNRQLKSALEGYKEYCVPDSLAAFEVEFVDTTVPVLAVEYIQGETLDKKILEGDRPLLHLSKAVDLLGVLQVKTYDVEAECEDYYEKIKSRLFDPASEVPHDAAEKIVENYQPVVSAFENLPHILDIDHHPENLLYTKEQKLMKIDNEGKNRVPFVFEHANLLNYTPGLKQKDKKKALNQLFEVSNKYSKMNLSWEEYGVGYYNAVLHRCISLCSAWSRPDRPELKSRREFMVNNGLSAISSLRDNFPSYFYDGNNSECYTELENALELMKANYSKQSSMR